MACNEYKKMIQARLDNELSREKNEELERHLAGCAECEDYSRRMSGSLDLYASVVGAEQAPELSLRFAETVAAVAAADAQKKTSHWARLAAAAAIIAITAALIAGYGARMTRDNSSPDKVVVDSISLKGQAIGVEIDRDKFVLHSRDVKGQDGIDLKF